MRKHWITAWALAGMTAGCTSASGSVASGEVAATPMSAGVQQVGWTPQAPQAQGPDKAHWYDPITSAFRSESAASPELYVSMAEMSLRGGNVPHARSLYQKVLAENPMNVAALLGAARMEDRDGQLDTALSLYDRAVKAQPNNSAALNDLALCLARRGDFPAAERVLGQAINLQPRNPLYRNNIAKILIEMNRTDHAMAQLSAVHPPAVVQYNAGVLLAERGRTNEATQHASAALAIDPRMDPARALLSQLAPTMPMPSVPVMQVAAPGMLPPGQHSIVQTAPASPGPAMTFQVDNSILPTPGGPSVLAAPSSDSTLPVSQAPTLLPPLN